MRVILILSLISILFCSPPPRDRFRNEESLTKLKRGILECIIKEETSSTDLKKYAEEMLTKDFKEELNLKQFRENETDRSIIRKCRREAFIQNAEVIEPLKDLQKHRYRDIKKKIEEEKNKLIK